MSSHPRNERQAQPFPHSYPHSLSPVLVRPDYPLQDRLHTHPRVRDRGVGSKPLWPPFSVTNSPATFAPGAVGWERAACRQLWSPHAFQQTECVCGMLWGMPGKGDLAGTVSHLSRLPREGHFFKNVFDHPRIPKINFKKSHIPETFYLLPMASFPC